MSTHDEKIFDDAARLELKRRDEAIETISALWPPDSEYSDTAHEGRQYLFDALASCWRCLPLPVLEHMAAQQLRRENK
jgi:hypothetical protein